MKRFWLPLLFLPLCTSAQEFALTSRLRDGRPAVLSTQQQTGARPKPSVQRVKRGSNGEPALPDNTSNPKPASVADQPPGFSSRRRKLRLRERN